MNIRITLAAIVSTFFVSQFSSASMQAFAQPAAPSEPEASGICYARQDLSARSPGFVTKILVRDGQPVKKGDVLVQLDDRLLVAGRKEAKAGVNAARAGLSLAEDGHRRLQRMATSKTASEQEIFQAAVHVEQARAQLEIARATLERVEVQLSDTKIRAELDGKVKGLPSVKGLFVQAGQSLGRVEAESSACAAAR